MLSLNRARKDNSLYLAHENLVDNVFKSMPALLEFKKDKVEDPSKNKLLNAPKTIPIHKKYVDKNGNEFGRKFRNFFVTVFPLVYSRFAWNNFQIQKNFPLKAQNTMIGPGYYKENGFDQAQ